MHFKTYRILRMVLLAFAGLTIALSARAQTTQNINNGWRFHKGDTTITELSPSKLLALTQPVQLPHTWNRTDAFDKYHPMYKGVGWYVKNLLISAKASQNVYLKFDGVLLTAQVYVNGKLAGSHMGGYTGFTVDISKYLRYGQQNSIAVKVDNSPNPVMAPLSGDFTRYGGIYRNVWLITKGQIHFNKTYGADELHITTPKVSKDEAIVQISGNIINETAVEKSVRVRHTVIDPSGKPVFTNVSSLKIKAGEQQAFIIKSNGIPHPKLWHPDHPSLYSVKSEILDTNGNVADLLNNHIGLRWFKLTADSGFFLNGEHLKLTGACRHQDLEGYANALSDAQNQRDMQLMKEMGANFTRLAHYPQDRSVLDACDKLGILVWMETPNVDFIDTTAAYAANSKNQQVEMIRQNYNHPSIVMWGFMNEIYLGVERRFAGDKKMQETLYQKTVGLAKEMNTLTKQEDPDRLTTIAFHGSDVYNKYHLGEITDNVGWNLYMGWYGSDFTQLDKFLDEQHRRYPNRPLIISEYGAGSDERINTLNPEQFDFSMQWQQKYVEYYLPVMEKRDWLTGSTAWILADFGSEGREETMPRVNNKGLLFFDRRKKDVFYYYQAFLVKNKPVLHIAVRDWTTRKMQLADGQTTAINEIKVYSNSPWVELTDNGKSLGRQKVDNYFAVFKVPLTSGNNLLQAKAVWNNNTVTDQASISAQLRPFDLSKNKTLSIGVNCGSNAWYHDTDQHYIYEPDQPYTKGNWGYIGGEQYKPINNRVGIQAQIANTTQDALYQTMRNNPTAYRFDVADGTYIITLNFADPSAARNNLVNDIGAGSKETRSERVFNVSINQLEVLHNLNVEKTYHARTAVQKSFTVKASGGKGIEIAFSAVEGKAFVNAIKVERKVK